MDAADRAEGHGNPAIAELGRKYWLTHIPWGSPNATRICHREVMKHAHFTSEQAWGYCAERHHEATGRWPGQKKGGKRAEQLAPSQERGAHVMDHALPPGAPGTLDLPDDWGDLTGLPDLTGLSVADLEAAAETDTGMAMGMGG